MTTEQLTEDAQLVAAAKMMKAGDLDAAERLLRDLQGQGPGSAAAYALGMLLVRRDRLDEAIDVLSRSVHAFPEHLRSRVGLAQAQERAGAFADALTSFRGALALDPKNQTAQDGIARLTARANGRPQTAEPTAQIGQKTTVSDLLEGSDHLDIDILRGELLGVMHRKVLSNVTWWLGLLAIALGFLNLLSSRDTSALGAFAQLAQQVAYQSGVLYTVVGLCLLLHAMLNSQTTRYEVRERAIDVTSGVLFRHRRTVWLWDVTEVDLQRPPWLLLSRTAQLVLFSGSTTLTVGRKPRTKLIGMGSPASLERLRLELQNRSLTERRAMKKQWV